MAGIGFEISRMGSTGGVAGIVGGSVFGIAVSSGPWLSASAAAAVFQYSLKDVLASADLLTLQGLLLHLFSISGMIAAPFGLFVTRLIADALYADEPHQISSHLLTNLAGVSLVATVAGMVAFGVAADLPAGLQLIAIAALVALSQLWLISVFLSAVRRFDWLLGAYGVGFAAAVVPALLAVQMGSVTLAAFALLVDILVTVAMLLFAVRRAFPEVPQQVDARAWLAALRRYWHIALTGFLATGAIWVDKWVFWGGPGSISASGALRMNPVYDTAAFLGLLALVPGLALILVVAETRFDRSFATLLDRCTGRSGLTEIERARRGVINAFIDGARLLLVVQAVVAFLFWVLAPALFDWLGADLRGLVPFRYVQVGNVFHILLLLAVMGLYYMDLGGRALIAWGTFLFASLLTALLSRDAGLGPMGWAYLAGAVSGAVVGWVLLIDALRNLTYLLFVANNPMIRGEQRRWA